MMLVARNMDARVTTAGMREINAAMAMDEHCAARHRCAWEDSAVEGGIFRVLAGPGAELRRLAFNRGLRVYIWTHRTNTEGT